MSRYFDNWERLVTATLKREELRDLARAHSRDPSLASLSSDCSFTSPLHEPEASSSSSIPFYSRGGNLPIPRPEDGILLLHDGDDMPISFIKLRDATRNFDYGNILGYGVFVPLFKGWINTDTLTAAEPGSGRAVAIRKCNDMPGLKEWLKGVNYLSQLHHPNLIKLLAYCDKDYKLHLVYEFMPKGSLFYHLFRGNHWLRSWNARIKAAVGAARGLSFLHNAENKEFNAKLSDFGYANFDCAKEVRTPNETPWGEIKSSYEHIGYASPEFRASGDWSEESDVYSFGVVLLELQCGRQAFQRKVILVDWGKPYLSNKKRVHRVLDPLLKIKNSHGGILDFAAVASRCMSEDPQYRPHMKEVLAELERIKSLSESPFGVRYFGRNLNFWENVRLKRS